MTFKILPYIKGTYCPDKFGKRDPDGTPFITKPTGKTCPGLFPDVFGINSFINGIFGNKTRGKITIYLGQGAGPRTFSAFNAMKDLKIFNKLV